MSNYSVYKHTSPSGKVYIGLTGQDPERRWKKGLGYSLNDHFFRAILKYGWDQFAHEIVYTGLTKEEACDLEKALIAQYDSTNPERGYNITPGGDASTQGPPTSEQRKKISEALKGRRLSERTREKIRERALKKRVRCTETGTVYDSTREAERQTGIPHGNISNCCRKTQDRVTAGGFHWEFVP